MHLVNHLGHFPMGIGAARLSSMVVEHDDVPGLSADELSAEVFSAPNIQVRAGMVNCWCKCQVWHQLRLAPVATSFASELWFKVFVKPLHYFGSFVSSFGVTKGEHLHGFTQTNCCLLFHHIVIIFFHWYFHYGSSYYVSLVHFRPFLHNGTFCVWVHAFLTFIHIYNPPLGLFIMFLVFPMVICLSPAFAVSKSYCHSSRTHVHIAEYLIAPIFVVVLCLVFCVQFYFSLFHFSSYCMSMVASVIVLSIRSVTVTKLFSFLSGQLFVLSNSLLVSLVELPALDVPGGGVTAGLRTAPSQVRIILRDLSGKASWDASILYCSPEDSVCSHRLMEEETGMFAVKKHQWLYPHCGGYVLVT